MLPTYLFKCQYYTIYKEYESLSFVLSKNRSFYHLLLIYLGFFITIHKVHENGPPDGNPSSDKDGNVHRYTVRGEKDRKKEKRKKYENL